MSAEITADRKRYPSEMTDMEFDARDAPGAAKNGDRTVFFNSSRIKLSRLEYPNRADLRSRGYEVIPNYPYFQVPPKRCLSPLHSIASDSLSHFA